MCLGVPGQVLELLAPAEHRAAVMVSGTRRTVDVSLVEDEGFALRRVRRVLVHAGLALSKITERKAQETLALLHEMSDAYLIGVASSPEGQPQ